MKVNYTPWNNPPIQRPPSISPFPRPSLTNIRAPPIIPRPPPIGVIQNRPNVVVPSLSPMVYSPAPPMAVVVSNPATIVQGIQRPTIHTPMPTSTMLGMPLPILSSSIQQIPGVSLQSNEVQTTIIEANQGVDVFGNPFASPQSSEIRNVNGVANQAIQTSAPVIQQATEMGSQINNSVHPGVFSFNSQAMNPTNVANSQQGSQIQNQQPQADTNNSLIRAQLNLDQNNDWQPIVTPRVYTFDYGFPS